MAKSPVSDIRTILKSGGKFFPTPSSALPIEKSIILPEYKEKSIAGTIFDLSNHCIGNVSMLSVCFSAYAEVCICVFQLLILMDLASIRVI